MLFFYALYFTIHPIQPNQVKTQVAENYKPSKNTF